MTTPSGLVEEYTVKRWGLEEGLPENSLQALCFTPDGFLWCVADHRLVRFDGVAFRDIPGPPDLPADALWLGAAADGAGGLWLYGTAGAYDWRDGRWTPCPLPAAGGRPPVLWMKQRADGALWAATPDGLWRAVGGAWRHYPLSAAGVSARLRDVAEDADGVLWLAAGDRLLRFAKDAYAGETLPPECRPPSPFLCLSIGRDGVVWAAAADALCRKRDGHWDAVATPGNNEGRRLGITRLHAADNGFLWVGTERTLYRMRYGLWTELLQDEQTPIRLARWIGAGPDGMLWVGAGDGLRQLRKRMVRVFTASLPLRRQTVTALHLDAQRGLLAALAGTMGLMQVRPEGDSSAAVQKKIPERLFISALAQDAQGVFWMGTQGEYLWRYRSNQVDSITQAADEERPAVNVNALLADRRGRLWAGTDAGLMLFDAAQGALRSFKDDAGQACTWHVNVLLEDRAGDIWAGTQDGGLWQLAEGKRWRRHAGVAAALPGGVILALREDDEGTLWIGGDAGLACWRGPVRAVVRVAALPDAYVAQILDDDLGFLWLGTRQGLARMRKAELRAAAAGGSGEIRVRCFGADQGFPRAPCTSGYGNLAVRTPDGRLWFATQDGLAMVAPWQIPAPVRERPRPYLETAEANGAPVWDRSSAAGGRHEPVLPPGSRDVVFAFTAPAFADPAGLRFSWRLEGYDADWTAPAPERRARYPRLPPGAYRFHLRAGADRDWQPAAQTLVLTVKPFFRQTWWWRGLLFAAGAGVAVLLALGLYRIRVRRQQQLDHLRLRIARDLHDEIGSNLGGIALLLDMAGQAGGAEAMQRIQAITRQSIESLKDLVWMIDPGHDALSDMVERMRGAAELLLQGIPYEFTVHGVAGAARAPLELRRNLLPIFKEALHNILKHARARRVNIELTLAARRLVLKVEDDGVGLPAAEAPGGHGLRYMQRRAGELHGRFAIAPRAGGGTVLTVELPM